MSVTINAQNNEFAASSGSNIDVTPNYSYFDHPPNSTKDLTITSNMGDDRPFYFEVGETYDLTWSGNGGGVTMNDATIIRSDYVGPGQGAIVFEGTNSANGEPYQIVWSPNFDLENWYWSNGGSPSNPNAFWTSDQNTAQTYQLPCYAPGTLILTRRGNIPIEEMTTDDEVATVDHGFQRVLWIKHGDQPLEDVEEGSKPVLIKAGALGPNLPSRDLTVSPQHRILVGGSGQLQQHFGREVLVPAKALTDVPDIRHMNGKDRITWVHFACGGHEVVWANGCLAESLLLGPMVVKSLCARECRALMAFFPVAGTDGALLNGPSARPCLSVRDAKRQIAEHRDCQQQRNTAKILKSDQDGATQTREAEDVCALQQTAQFDGRPVADPTTRSGHPHRFQSEGARSASRDAVP